MSDFKSFCLGDNGGAIENQGFFIASSEAFTNQKVRLMPDACIGKLGPVGFTGTFSDKIIPNVVGVDICCSVSAYEFTDDEDIDLVAFDEAVRDVMPSGFNIRVHEAELSKTFPYEKLHCWSSLSDAEQNCIRLSMGTLGSGNHYAAIEVGEDTGKRYFVIHCGSRSLGVKVADYYSKLADENMKRHCDALSVEKDIAIANFRNRGEVSYIQPTLDAYKKCKEKLENDIPFIEVDVMNDYLDDMLLCNEWVVRNHQTIADEVMARTGYNIKLAVQSHHNYVDVANKIVRKGAISAQEGEVGIIPLNMRDGSLIVIGKGNEDWNMSLPHGAGRTMSRKEAKQMIDMEDYTASMNGIYTTTVNTATLDEAPMAYKNADAIMAAIEPNATIVERILPIYNFKDDTAEKERR